MSGGCSGLARDGRGQKTSSPRRLSIRSNCATFDSLRPHEALAFPLLKLPSGTRVTGEYVHSTSTALLVKFAFGLLESSVWRRETRVTYKEAERIAALLDAKQTHQHPQHHDRNERPHVDAQALLHRVRHARYDERERVRSETQNSVCSRVSVLVPASGVGRTDTHEDMRLGAKLIRVASRDVADLAVVGRLRVRRVADLVPHEARRHREDRELL